MKYIKQIIVALIVLVAGYFGIDLTQNHQSTQPTASQPAEQHTASQQRKDEAHKIAQAFQQRRSDVQVQGVGQVIAVLPDDNKGSRHQKFLLKLSNGITILVAHNIDLAPRINGLKKGDTVEFYGEYEYSEKGGIIHWTHHDPQKRHVGGWLKHNNKVYE